MMGPPASLAGCIPILCTPFTDDGALDLPSLEREVDWVLVEGARAVACLAIASEGYKLTDPERDEVLRTVVATVGSRVPVVASAHADGVEPATERARRVVALGASAVMVLPPSFVKPDTGSLVDYYRRVADAASVPMIVQDAPQLTGVSMGPDLWARMADQIPNFRYLKLEGAPQGTAIAGAVARIGDQVSVFCGWGGLGVLDALDRGAVGTMSAPNFTRLFGDIQRRYERGDIEGAERVFATDLPLLLWSMQSIDHSIAVAKEELRCRGILTSAHQRGPGVRLDAVARRQLDRFLDRRFGR